MLKVSRTSVLKGRCTRVLVWIWLSWITVFAVQALLFSPGADQAYLQLVLVLVHLISTIVILAAFMGGWSSVLVTFGLLVRVGAMFVDLYSNSGLPITASPDDVRFLAAGTAIASDLSLAGHTYGGAYSSLLGYIFYLVGPSELVAQYINVLFGTSALLMLVALLQILQVDESVALGVLAVGAFMPAAVFFSAQLLRESLIQLLVTASAALFIAGLLRRRWRWIMLSVSLVLAASLFHAGVIAMLIGYALVIAFTKYETGQVRISFRRLVPTIMVALVAGVVLAKFPDLFLAKFQNFDSGEELFASANRREGGAAYLTSLNADSALSLFLYAPVRGFYFLVSPLPWDWRGLMDSLAFLFDSTIYVMALTLAIPRKSTDQSRGMLLGVLVVVLSCAVLVFGIGVSNSGTAMRHRSKIVMIVLAMCGLSLDRRRGFGSQADAEREVVGVRVGGLAAVGAPKGN